MGNKIEKEDSNQYDLSYNWKPAAFVLIIAIIIIIIVKVFFHL